MQLIALAGDAEVTAGSRVPPAAGARILDAAGLRALDAEAWDTLARQSLVENPFYSRQHVLAGLDTIDRGSALRALALDDSDGSLLGLFPFAPRGKVPSPVRTAFGGQNRYQFCGTPLVHRDHADAVIGSWLDLVVGGTVPRLWVLPDIDMGSPLAALILGAARKRNLFIRQIMLYERAYLTRLPGGLEAHLERVLSKNRLKDVRRTMRRLGEVGTIALEHVDDPVAMRARLEDFLALEHAGWKGTRGTSFLARHDDAAFARAAYAAPLAAMDSLLLDGKAVAMKLSIRTGDCAFTPKIAYDETHRKLGPGMALEYLLIEAFYASGDPVAVDAAATAEGHSALSFFNDHKEMATLIIGASDWQVALTARLFGLREQLKRWRRMIVRDS